MSMDTIAKRMTIPKAVDVLRKHHLDNAELMQVTKQLAGKQLRQPQKGYSGIDGARKLLNDMIFESMTKYDAEIAKCTSYYAEQCAAMEACRSQIAAANYVAANSRAPILDAQAIINVQEVEIPKMELELKQHNLKCKSELAKMEARLKIVMGDIAVMTMILEMTDCEKKLIQQRKFSLLHCQDQCTKTSFLMFDHDGLQKKVGQLQSKVSRSLLQDTFKDLVEGVQGLEGLEFRQEPMMNKTEFNNPPLPKTPVPRNPCTDPYAGAPSAADKAAAKCTIKKSPQCYKLQERFLLIQAGIQDERDDLMTQISNLEQNCQELKSVIEKQIQDTKDQLSSSQTKLATASEK